MRSLFIQGVFRTTMSDQKSRRILLAVSGMSPQIITETLYGLLHRTDAVWLPDEIHLITTSGGREQVRLQLLGDHGHFSQFLRDFNIRSPIHFDLSTIHVITDNQGQTLADLRTPQDNEAAADFITEKIRELTSQGDTELHVSLAGGRKTMGFYIGYALSLFGRPQDRLSHVLVSEGYESLSGFYYPTPETRTISTRNDQKLDAALAEVYLAEIPFVRLRGFLPVGAFVNRARFSEVVALLETLTDDPLLTVLPKEQVVRVGQIIIELGPREMALYMVFVHAVQSGKSVIGVPKKGNIDLGNAYLTELEFIKGDMGDTEVTSLAMSKGMTREYFDSIKSRLNKALEKGLGRQGCKPYQIQSRGRGSAQFWLAIVDSKISIEE